MIHFLMQVGTLTSAKNLVGGLLFGATTLFANPEAPTKPMSFDASVYVTQQGKIKLALQKVTPGAVSVQLLDQEKHVLYSTAIGKNQLKASMVFDVSDVQDGTYTLEIKSNEGSIQKQVNIATPKYERTIAMQ